MLWVGTTRQTWRAQVPGRPDVGIGDADAMPFSEAVAAVLALAEARLPKSRPRRQWSLERPAR